MQRENTFVGCHLHYSDFTGGFSSWLLWVFFQFWFILVARTWVLLYKCFLSGSWGRWERGGSNVRIVASKSFCLCVGFKQKHTHYFPQSPSLEFAEGVFANCLRKWQTRLCKETHSKFVALGPSLEWADALQRSELLTQRAPDLGPTQISCSFLCDQGSHSPGLSAGVTTWG